MTRLAQKSTSDPEGLEGGDEGRGGSLLPKPGLDREWLAKKCGAADGTALMKAGSEMAREVRGAYDQITGKLLAKP